jgi:hypothetical protein
MTQELKTDAQTETAQAGSVQRLVRRWRDGAEQLEMQALRHAGEYGRGNDVWVKLTVRAETLKDCALQLEMDCDHEWHALARLPKGWQDVCVKCGEHRLSPNSVVNANSVDVLTPESARKDKLPRRVPGTTVPSPLEMMAAAS